MRKFTAREKGEERRNVIKGILIGSVLGDMVIVGMIEELPD